MDTLSTESDSTLSTQDVETSALEFTDGRRSMDAADEQVNIGIGTFTEPEESASHKSSRITRNRSELFLGNNEITIRDASSVAMSECTKPDPPSVIDNVMIEEADNIDGFNYKKSDSSKLDLLQKTGSSFDFDLIVSAGDIFTNENKGTIVLGANSRLLKQMSSLDVQETQSSVRDDKLNTSIHSSDSGKIGKVKASMDPLQHTSGFVTSPSTIGRSLLDEKSSRKADGISYLKLNHHKGDVVPETAPNNSSVITRPLEPNAMHSNRLLVDHTRNNIESDLNIFSAGEEKLQLRANETSELHPTEAEIFTTPHDTKYLNNHLAQLHTVYKDAEAYSDRRKVRQQKSSGPDPVTSNGNFFTHRNGTFAPSSGKRKVILRLQEELRNDQKLKVKGFQNSILGHIRRRSSGMIFGSRSSLPSIDDLQNEEDDSHIPRGKISVSWYEGTSSFELHEHVRHCILRKLMKSNAQEATFELEDIRILDEDSDPVEEVVLSPFIPDGSYFTCRFSVRDLTSKKGGTFTPVSEYSTVRASLSPGIGPSPRPEKNIFDGLTSKQLETINKKLNASIRHPEVEGNRSERKKGRLLQRTDHDQQSVDSVDKSIQLDAIQDAKESVVGDEASSNTDENVFIAKKENDETSDDVESDTLLHSEDPIESRFREIFQLLLTERKKSPTGTSAQTQQQEKRQVIFVVSNYLVLFLAVLAICAEVQARVPAWLQAMERQMLNVHNCGATQEALFECISRGDLAGLLASIGLWFSRSLATKRIFLFGFESPKKLWTVVYESLVTAVCWGISHLFIRRGLNPDTRERFVQRHWKDTLYGSLAVVHAAFLKLVLKNLVPQEVIEVAVRERQIKILSWLPTFYE